MTAEKMMELADEIETRRGKDLYMMQPDRDLVVTALRASAVGAGAPPGSDRMRRARALYLAVYESQGANWEANDCKELWCDKADRYLALTEPVQPSEKGEPDGDTIQILLDLLNPLHGEIDRQLPPQFTDEREWDAPDDREYSVNITARMERDLTQAVLILENRRSALPSDPVRRTIQQEGN